MKFTGINGVLCPITVMYCRVDESLVTGRIRVVGSMIDEHTEIILSRRNKRIKV